MILAIFFWILLLLYALGAFTNFPPRAQHVVLCILLLILGIKVFGNPLNG